MSGDLQDQPMHSGLPVSPEAGSMQQPCNLSLLLTSARSFNVDVSPLKLHTLKIPPGEREIREAMIQMSLEKKKNELH